MIYCDKCSRMLDEELEICPICGTIDENWEISAFQQETRSENSKASENSLRGSLGTQTFDRLQKLNQHIEETRQTQKIQPFHEFQQAKQTLQAQQEKYSQQSERIQQTYKYGENSNSTEQPSLDWSTPDDPPKLESLEPTPFMRGILIFVAVAFACFAFIPAILLISSPNEHISKLGRTMILVSAITTVVAMILMSYIVQLVSM
ncbi:MAG: hypothetical protein FWG64_11740 [Firmicutes bacterium]|nr:hypothetical protein [Bacillota bacterium]